MAPGKRNAIIIPRYTCGILQIDCGGGYCCPVGRVCFNSGDEPTCRLAPGIPGTDQPASPAQDATTTTTTASFSSSASSYSSSTTPPSPTSTSLSTSIPAPASTPSSSPLTGTGISGSGIAGIVVGVLLVATLLGGSVWSLIRRKKRERVREMAVLPDGGSRSDDIKSFFAGGTARRVSTERRESLETEREPRRGRLPQMGGWRRPESREDGVGEGRVVRGRAASWGDWEHGGMAYMYGGSNVGVGPGEVPGRVEAVGDVPGVPLPTHVVVRKEVGSRRGERPPVYELDGSSPLARIAARRLTE